MERKRIEELRKKSFKLKDARVQTEQLQKINQEIVEIAVQQNVVQKRVVEQAKQPISNTQQSCCVVACKESIKGDEISVQELSNPHVYQYKQSFVQKSWNLVCDCHANQNKYFCGVQSFVHLLKMNEQQIIECFIRKVNL